MTYEFSTWYNGSPLIHNDSDLEFATWYNGIPWLDPIDESLYAKTPIVKIGVLIDQTRRNVQMQIIPSGASPVLVSP